MTLKGMTLTREMLELNFRSGKVVVDLPEFSKNITDSFALETQLENRLRTKMPEGYEAQIIVVSRDPLQLAVRVFQHVPVFGKVVNGKVERIDNPLPDKTVFRMDNVSEEAAV